MTSVPSREAMLRLQARWSLAKCLSQGRSPTTTDVLAAAVDFMDSPNVARPKVCPECHGTGDVSLPAWDWWQTVECPECGGAS